MQSRQIKTGRRFSQCVGKRDHKSVSAKPSDSKVNEEKSAARETIFKQDFTFTFCGPGFRDP